MRAKGVLIAGSAGGGKTTRARQMHAQHDGISIWLNHNEERVQGIRVSSVDQMETQVKKCRSTAAIRNLRFNLVCSSVRSGAATARTFGQAIGKHFDAGICTQVIIDEAHQGLPDSEAESSVNSGNPIAGMLHEDRDQNVKVVLLTQDPVELYYPPLKQCKYFVWCGGVMTWHKGFIEYYNFREMKAGPGVQDASLPTQDHEVIVIQPTLPPVVIERTETDPQFG